MDAATDIGELCRATAEELTRRFDCGAAAVWIRHGDALVAEGRCGATPERVAGPVLLRPHLMPDGWLALLRGDCPLLAGDGVLVVPLILGGEVTGLLEVVPEADDRPDDWSEALQLAARHLAQALNQCAARGTRASALCEALRVTVRVAGELASSPDDAPIWRQAIEVARSRLGLERCAIFVRDGDLVRGTYGTDRWGQTTDERSVSFPLNDFWHRQFSAPAPGERLWQVAETNHEYWEDGRRVDIGRGWVVATRITCGDRCEAVFCNDAALSGTPLDEVKQEALALLCSLLGPLIALRLAHQRLRAVVETQTEMICRHRPDGTLTFVNDAFATFFGRPPAELIGTSVLPLLPDDDRERILRHVAALTRERPTVTAELRVPRGDGQWRWHQWTCYATFGADGQVAEYQGVGRDITDHKRVVDALADRERFLSLALEGSRFGVWDWNLAEGEGRIYGHWAEFLGYEPDEIRLPLFMWDELVHPDDRHDVVDALRAHIDGTVPLFETEHRVRAKSGEWRWLFVRGLAVDRDASGRATRIVGIHTDVTARRAVMAELRRAKLAAEAADRTKAAFLASISHELLTPLNGMIGMTELALGTEVTEEQRHYLDVSLASAEWLRSLLDDVLEFSALEADRPRLDRLPFDLRASFEETILALAPRAQAKGLELLLRVEPEVPPVLLGDVRRLRQILANLVGNAIKFTAQGHVLVRVAAVLAGEGTRLRITVADTGIGIAADQQRSIFEPFVQADTSTTRPFPGSGLGLAVVARLAALMNGEVAVESRLGAGSLFRATVVVGRPPQPTEGAPPPPEAWAGRRVVLINGLPVAGKILAEMLADWSVILQREDEPVAGAEAPLAVIVDVHGAGADWWSRAECLASRHVAVPVILLQPPGWKPADAGQAALARVLKPLRQGQLRAVLERCGGPVAEAAAGVGEAETPEVSVTNGRAGRILVVEDNETTRELAGIILERHGYRPTLVSNAHEALDAVGAEPFDVVLMDVQMPGLDGYEATARLRALPSAGRPPLRVLALTARALPADRERCLSAGMDGYVSKPFRAQELIAAIEQLRALPIDSTP